MNAIGPVLNIDFTPSQPAQSSSIKLPVLSTSFHQWLEISC